MNYVFATILYFSLKTSTICTFRSNLYISVQIWTFGGRNGWARKSDSRALSSGIPAGRRAAFFFRSVGTGSRDRRRAKPVEARRTVRQRYRGPPGAGEPCVSRQAGEPETRTKTRSPGSSIILAVHRLPGSAINLLVPRFSGSRGPDNRYHRYVQLTGRTKRPPNQFHQDAPLTNRKAPSPFRPPPAAAAALAGWTPASASRALHSPAQRAMFRPSRPVSGSRRAPIGPR